jgi:hypothetical protein
MTHLKPDLVDNNLTKLLQYIAVAGQEIARKLTRLFERLRSLNWALQGGKSNSLVLEIRTTKSKDPDGFRSLNKKPVASDSL